MQGTQAAFDIFYNRVLDMLDFFYPVSSISISSRDPPFMTPTLKSMLRQKNYFMNSGQIEKANALANHIGTRIIHNNTESLMDCDPKAPGGAKVMWAKVNEITGKKSRPKASASVYR